MKRLKNLKPVYMVQSKFFEEETCWHDIADKPVTKRQAQRFCIENGSLYGKLRIVARGFKR